MSRRILISVGTSKYDYLPEDQQRPKLNDVVSSISKTFTKKLGYSEDLKELRKNPTSIQLRNKLDQWLSSKERNCSDWIVLYYTGHGELVDDNLFLLTRDYKSGLHSSTAFQVDQLGKMIAGRDSSGEYRRTRRFLLILDTCYSGTGVFEIINKLSSQFSKGINDSMFYILSASFPNEEAMAGGLAKALLNVLEDNSLGGTQQKFIFFDQIVPAINVRLKAHKVLFSNITSPSVEPEFFPNPFYVPGIPANLTVKEIKSAIEGNELLEFWDPKSRGLDQEFQSGWYFTGREKILGELSDWLNDDKNMYPHIITGRAGSGKSAILSRIVTISDKEYFEKLPFEEKRKAEKYYFNIDLAIYAKGKSMDEVVKRFANHFEIEPTISEILKTLKDLNKVFRIVIDALDESSEPYRIVRELINPICTCHFVKLLIGTRSEYIELLGTQSRVFNVDDPVYIEKGDIQDYVKHRLLSTKDPKIFTPYRGQIEFANRVAKIIAEKAYPNFLIAKLETEYLLTLPNTISEDSLLKNDIPQTVSQAFSKYFSRFGDDEKKVRDILRALAFAEGSGLPWDNIWTGLSSKLSQKDYTNDDIRWVLDHAGSFIRESVENGRSVYRLYHQSLSDYFTQGHESEEIQNIITQALVETVPIIENSTIIDWRLANPYLKKYLPLHAGKGRILMSLINDPLFLLCMDSFHLITSIEVYGSDIPRDIVYVYKNSIHHIREKSINEAASYLLMKANQRGVTIFDKHPSIVLLLMPWVTMWTQWDPEIPNNTVGIGDAPITTFVTATWDLRQVAIVGRANGSCEIWDISEGSRIAIWSENKLGNVSQIGFVESSEGPLLIVHWDTSSIGVKNLKTEEFVIKKVNSKILALHVTQRNKEHVCISSHEDLVLRIWSLPFLVEILSKPKATGSDIFSLSTIQNDENNFLISVGDYLTSKEGNSCNINLWSLPDLNLAWTSPPPYENVFHNIESTIYSGRQLTVLSQNNWGPFQIWDFEKRILLYQSIERSDYAFFFKNWNSHFLINIGLKKLYLYHIDQSPVNKDLILTEIDLPIFKNNVLIGSMFRHTFSLNASSFILSCDVDRIKVWDIEELINYREKANIEFPFTGEISSLVVDSNNTLYVGTYESIVVINANSGIIIYSIPLETYQNICQLILMNENELLVGTSSGHILIINIRSNNHSIQIVSKDDYLETMRVILFMNKKLILATIRTKSDWRVKIINALTFQEIPTKNRYSLTGGQADKQLFGLAATVIGENLRIAFASKYGKVRIADFDENKPDLPAIKEWHLMDSNGEYIIKLHVVFDSTKTLLIVGNDNGQLHVFDFISGEMLSIAQKAHLGPVIIITSFELNKRTIIISGGDDGVIKFWTPYLELLFKIELEIWISSLVVSSDLTLYIGTSRGVEAIQIKNIKELY